MGRPVENPQITGSALAESVARARAGQIKTRLRVATFPATTSDDVRDKATLAFRAFRRRLDIAGGIADPHERLAQMLRLAEEIAPVLAATYGRGPHTTARWLEWALVEFRKPHNEQASNVRRMRGGTPNG